MFLSTFIILMLFSKFIFYQFDTLESFLAIMTCCFAITIAEAMSNNGSDNLSIPITAFFFIEIFNIVYIQNLIIGFSFMTILIAIVLFIFTKKTFVIRWVFKLYFDGRINFRFWGLKYVLPMMIFFILSTFLSRIGPKHLQASKNGRTANQVFSNGGAGLVLCIINNFYHNELIFYMFLASVAAANSDTWATEIGKLSKTRLRYNFRSKSFTRRVRRNYFYWIIGGYLWFIYNSIIGYFLNMNTSYFIIVFISGFLVLFDQY